MIVPFLILAGNLMGTEGLLKRIVMVVYKPYVNKSFPF
jgi:TRAP-type C4-dicarboxylate transport system permease large subunit